MNTPTHNRCILPQSTEEDRAARRAAEMARLRAVRPLPPHPLLRFPL